MTELRSIIWPSEPEPVRDPLGTHFYLHLLAAWFGGLARLAPHWADDVDIMLTDGSFYRVIAKAHTRASLDPVWLASLFDQALQPDHVVLLDIDPADAWLRRSAFKTTEIGCWDGQVEDPRSGFCAYQTRIRHTLIGFAERDRWTILRQAAATSPEEIAEAAERALARIVCR